MTVDTEKYLEFVEGVTSNESLHYASLISRMNNLELEDDCNVPQLLTAALGLTAEAGECLEIVKKMIFQGKPWSEDNREHLVIELGDAIWYIANACMALEVSFDEVVALNVKKLKKRYPGGQFDVYYSENREEGDR